MCEDKDKTYKGNIEFTNSSTETKTEITNNLVTKDRSNTGISNSYDAYDLYIPTNEEVEEALTICELKATNGNITIIDEPLEHSLCENRNCDIISLGNNEYLTKIWDKTPAGIIETPFIGIGELELELRASRRSIILVSSYAEMREELLRGTLDLRSIIDFTHISLMIENYLNANANAPKILLSLNTAMQALNVLSVITGEWFFMIQDYDELITKSYSKDIVGIMELFSDTRLEQKAAYVSFAKILTSPSLKALHHYRIEPHINLGNRIWIKKTSSIIATIQQYLSSSPEDEKTVILYPNTSMCHKSILYLPEKQREECCILAPSSEQKYVKEYYINYLDTDKRIIFVAETSYIPKLPFKYNLIVVNELRRVNTSFSLRRLKIYLDIMGPKSLTTGIIYNEAHSYREWDKQLELALERARKMVDFIKDSIDISRDDGVMSNVFTRCRRYMENKVRGIVKGGYAPFKLIRNGHNNDSIIAYENFDNIKYRLSLVSNLYEGELLKNKLVKYYSLVSYYDERQDIAVLEVIKKDIKDKTKEERDRRQRLNKEDRTAILNQIEEAYNKGKTTLLWLQKESRKGSTIRRKVFGEVLKLYDYIDTIELLTLLRDVKSNNTTGFKNLNNSIMFWALEDEHPLKVSIKDSFKHGDKITNTEILEKIVPILNYHLDAGLSDKKRKPITLFKCFVNAVRPRYEYVIIPEDRFHLHKNRIGKEVNDLLQYFML